MIDLAEQRKKVIRSNYAAFNNGDIDGVLENLHPEIELVGADEDGRLNESELWQGHEEARRFYDGLRNEIGLQWIEIVSLETEGEGDTIVATVWLHGSSDDQNLEGAVPAVRRHIFDGTLIRRVETYRQGWELPSFDETDNDPASGPA
ncbi:MAG TPA: nuclear transport factor 2 family protein [Solirubrobacterales bacterium]|nr:nuclear transport factor 2 family protein [Solirubrobacterales bacterium]